jgi:hypothetical protein
VEWFRFEDLTLTAAAVNMLNHIMNLLHTSTKSAVPLTSRIRDLTTCIKTVSNQIESSSKVISESMEEGVKNTDIRNMTKELKECLIEVGNAQETLKNYKSLLHTLSKLVISSSNKK